MVARLWIRVSKFGSLALEDGFIILATCCLVGDLAIQQYMWNLGMAEMGTASRQDFIHIMQVSWSRWSDAGLCADGVEDDCARIDSLRLVAMGHQNRPRAVLQEARCERNETTNHLQRRVGTAGGYVDSNFLPHHLSVFPAQQEMVPRSDMYVQLQSRINVPAFETNDSQTNVIQPTRMSITGLLSSVRILPLLQMTCQL